MGSANAALGDSALANATGGNNTAVGNAALLNTISGEDNIALGYQAGQGITTGSNNIEIGNQGGSNDSGVIRIGTAGSQTEAIMAGIYGVTIGNGAAVVVSSYGQLGVQSSSIRFKEDVHDMADASDALMQLRPVEFRYKQADPDGTIRCNLA